MRDRKNPAKHLYKWLQKRNTKIFEKVVKKSIEIEEKVLKVRLTGSLEKLNSTLNLIKSEKTIMPKNLSFAESLSREPGFYQMKALQKSGSLSTSLTTSYPTSQKSVLNR